MHGLNLLLHRISLLSDRQNLLVHFLLLMSNVLDLLVLTCLGVTDLRHNHVQEDL